MRAPATARPGAKTGRPDTNVEIHSAAAALFARHGYRATTLDDVAAAVGVKKASVYHYIDSKEDLLIAIYGRIFDQIEEAVRPIATLDLAPDERMRRMIHAHIAVVAQERDMLTVAFQEESELPERHQRLIRKRKRTYEQFFESVLDEGQRNGTFRVADVRITVYGLLGMCNWIHKWYTPKFGAPSAIAGVFASVFESGLRAGVTGPDATGGAWPRPASVDEALEGAVRVADELARDIDRLREELASAELRLRDGLASQTTKASARKRATTKKGNR